MFLASVLQARAPRRSSEGRGMAEGRRILGVGPAQAEFGEVTAVGPCRQRPEGSRVTEIAQPGRCHATKYTKLHSLFTGELMWYALAVKVLLAFLERLRT